MFFCIHVIDGFHENVIYRFCLCQSEFICRATRLSKLFKLIVITSMSKIVQNITPKK